jgi:inosine/xanthosine triphosphate pyrophosphatase family protein
MTTNDAFESTIYLGTSSSVKSAQYAHLFARYGIRVLGVPLRLPLTEPQVEGVGSTAEALLVTEPLKSAARWVTRTPYLPFLIEDTMLFVEHFNDNFFEEPLLPGPDTKRWWSALGAEGILRLMQGSERREAIYVCQFGVLFGTGWYQTYRAEVRGSIAREMRTTDEAFASFPRTNAEFFHSIFVPTGSNHTYGEMGPAEFASFDYRARCVDAAAPQLRSILKDFPHQAALDLWPTE